MRDRSAFVAALGLTVAACGDVAGAPYIDMLVDRFDVPQCQNAEFFRMAGERVEEGHRVKREFVADRDCMQGLERALIGMDFEEQRPGTFVAERDNGWTETVSIGRWFDNTRTNVRWEEINP